MQKDFWYGDDSCRPAGQTQEGTSFPQLLAQLLCRSCVIVLYVQVMFYVVLTLFVMLHKPSPLFVQPLIFILILVWTS